MLWNGTKNVVINKNLITEDFFILSIDDIYTTGATIDEIARVLKDPWSDRNGEPHNGAARVDCLTFSTGTLYTLAFYSGRIRDF